MQELQTLGICVGSVALVAIAGMMFFMMLLLTNPQEEIMYGSVADMMDGIANDDPPRGRRKK